MKNYRNRIVSAIAALLLAVTPLASCADATGAKNTTAAVTTKAAPAGTTAADESTEPEAKPVELYISAAASLTESLNRLKELYETENPEITLIINYGSSGTLQTQIEEGADADVFISAAQKQMNALEDKGLLLTDSRIDLLENKVVLIVPVGSSLGLASFEDAATDKVSMIAVGDPASVPVGQYAQEIFTTLGIWDAVSAKANLGSDVKAVLSWVETGNVDCGVVYATDAATSDGVTIVCEAPEGSHAPVIYPAAVVEASKNPDAAEDFLAYLQSGEASQIFSDNGFAAVQ